MPPKGFIPNLIVSFFNQSCLPTHQKKNYNTKVSRECESHSTRRTVSRFESYDQWKTQLGHYYMAFKLPLPLCFIVVVNHSYPLHSRPDWVWPIGSIDKEDDKILIHNYIWNTSHIHTLWDIRSIIHSPSNVSHCTRFR